MKKLNQGIIGYKIPSYVEEILTHNYCPYFMKMSIVRDGDSYRFIYKPGNMERIRTDIMDIYTKLVLLRTLEDICEKTRSYLITPDSFLIEPELIYAKHSDISDGSIHLMFYPDAKRMDAAHKLMIFAERIRNNNNREEREFFDQFRNSIENGDINRSGLFLDKNILRLEGRMIGRAS